MTGANHCCDGSVRFLMPTALAALGLATALACSPRADVAPDRDEPGPPPNARPAGEPTRDESDRGASPRADAETERGFEKWAGEWKAYCEQPEIELSSDIQAVLDCEPFRKLVGMGKPVIPPIMGRFETNGDGIKIRDGLRWEFVLQDITGEPFIDDPGDIDFQDARRRCLEWWDRHKTP